MDRNVEQQFRCSIYFRAKFVFCTQVCEQNLTLWGVARVSRTLAENWSRFLIIRHVAKLDFNPPLSYECLI